MIDLYIVFILNGWKVLICFEELGFFYEVRYIDFMKLEQK